MGVRAWRVRNTIGEKRKWLIGCNIRKHEKINIVGYTRDNSGYCGYRIAE